MRHVGAVLLAVALGATSWACQKDDSAVVKKLDEMVSLQRETNTKLDQLIARGGAGAARPAPRGPMPGRPDPSAVYAVPIEGAPFKGAKNAKITIVEAFEFA